MLRIRRTKSAFGMWVRLAFAFSLLAAVKYVPDRVQGFVLPALPVVRLWFDIDAQYRLHLGDVPYDLLRSVDAALPPDATVLLITSGRDVRHLEYTTFHRALYFLAPRPVWWVSPAPSDGTWEARWWISAPLSADSIRRVAQNKLASYVLAYDLGLDLPIGQKVAEWPNGYLLQLDEQAAPLRSQAPSPIAADAAWPIRLLGALAVIFALGGLALTWIARWGYRVDGVEAGALAWMLGAGLVSIGMLWLDAIGVSLDGQIVALALIAAVGLATSRRVWLARIKRARAVLPRWRSLRPDAVSILLIGFLVLEVSLLAVMAVGRPFGGWDSWSSWGMRARTIFIQRTITPAVYADPSRASTLPQYPLSEPLIAAWVYGWLDAPDDRLVGAVKILSYLSLAGVCYAAIRRRGASRRFALSAAVVVASMPHITLLGDFGFVDLPLAVLVAIAASYLIQWLEGGPPGAWIIGVLAAGLMPWMKREGLVLAAVLGLSLLVVGRGSRRAWLGVGGVALAAILFYGPWGALIASTGGARGDFLSVSLETLRSNLSRLPTLARLVGSELLGPNWSYIWPLAGASAIVLMIKRPASRERASSVFVTVAVVYLIVMGSSYLFSSFVPYAQHILSSFYRLVAQVAPLPVLWMSFQAIEEATL